jgi:hypothetical protein
LGRKLGLGGHQDIIDMMEDISRNPALTGSQCRELISQGSEY